MRKILILLAIIVFHAVISTTYAQEIKTEISPSFYHLVSRSGSSHLFVLDLVNNGDPQIYNFRLYELGNPDLYGNLYPLPEITSPVDIEITAPYIHFDEQFLLRTGDRQKVPVEVMIPQDTKEGEYYFAISAETVSPVPSQGSASIQLSGGNAALLIVTVTSTNEDKKNVETSLFKAVTGFTIPWGNSTLHFVDTNTPVPISLIAKNSGRYIVTPRGEITLKNHANEVQRFGIVPVYLYPGSQRLLTTADFTKETCLERFSEGLCNKDYSLIVEKLPSGFYEATATVTYGDPSPLIYSRDYFIVIPVGIVLGIIFLIAIAFSFLGFAWYKHLHPHRHYHRHHK